LGRLATYAGNDSDADSGIGENFLRDVGGGAKTVVEFAYNRIRSDILCGNLQPESRLRMDRLRQSYGIGINSLREALTRLTADGLVLATGQRGFTVKPISLGDLKDITEMREFLESRALAQAIEHGDLDWEGRIAAAYHKLSRAEQKLSENSREHAMLWEERNREFHAALISACPSPWLLHFQSVMYSQSQRYRMLSLVERSIPRDETFQEHRLIMEATLDRDISRATELLRHHIVKGAQVTTPRRLVGLGTPGSAA